MPYCQSMSMVIKKPPARFANPNITVLLFRAGGWGFAAEGKSVWSLSSEPFRHDPYKMEATIWLSVWYSSSAAILLPPYDFGRAFMRSGKVLRAAVAGIQVGDLQASSNDRGRLSTVLTSRLFLNPLQPYSCRSRIFEGCYPVAIICIQADELHASANG